VDIPKLAQFDSGSIKILSVAGATVHPIATASVDLYMTALKASGFTSDLPRDMLS